MPSQPDREFFASFSRFYLVILIPRLLPLSFLALQLRAHQDGHFSKKSLWEPHSRNTTTAIAKLSRKFTAVGGSAAF
jgi:hypothetical protein